MEGRRKEILLLVLAVAALGLAAFYTFRGNKAPAPPLAQPAQQQEMADSSASVGAEQEATGDVEGGTSSATASGRQRNPFSAPGTPGTAPEMPPGDAEATPEGVLGEMPMEGEVEQPSLVLTGIVDGSPTVAILRQDDQRFFVKVGDFVGDGYRVQSIARQQVVLAGHEGNVILRMGGRQ